MAKKLVVAMLCVVACLTMTQLEAASEYHFEIHSESFEVIEGAIHRRFEVTIHRGGHTSRQVIHLLEGNPTQNPRLKVVVGDGFSDMSYGRQTLPVIATNIEVRHAPLQVIGGINGDFFNMITGIPVEAHVRDGEVLAEGLGYERPLIGFKEDGSVVFGRPCFGPYTMTIFDAYGHEKITLDVSRFNQPPTHDEDVTVYFEQATQVPLGHHQAFTVSAADIKSDGHGARYYGRGPIISLEAPTGTVDSGTFVVVSDHPALADLRTVGDIVRVHRPLGCDFEGVKWVIGAWGHLVKEGQAVQHFTEGAGIYTNHPRTAVGVREDGTVLLVTVDGRNPQDGMTGMTMMELADLMAHLGAVEAYNLDGGGSTTMVTAQDQGFHVVNTPSDGSVRPVSNGIFFVVNPSQSGPPTHNQTVLTTPTQVHIDQHVLTWQEVPNRAGFRVDTGEDTMDTAMRKVDLSALPPGLHSVRVKALGDGWLTQDSPYSSPQSYLVYPHDYEALNTFIRNLAMAPLNP